MERVGGVNIGSHGVRGVNRDKTIASRSDQIMQIPIDSDVLAMSVELISSFAHLFSPVPSSNSITSSVLKHSDQEQIHLFLTHHNCQRDGQERIQEAIRGRDYRRWIAEVRGRR